ncbi:MAG: transcription initiation protein [Chitinophagaceae bacterium]|nr:transcription initiation protein [Chitinophagaceae bacterium]
MEKFMFIFHGGQIPTQSPEEMQAHMGKWMAWIDKLAKTDQYVSGEPLLPGGKLVSGKGGKTVTDGPYTEGKEVVGGFFIIKAKNMDEAVAIAKDCPDYDLDGSVQVRQVMKMDM